MAAVSAPTAVARVFIACPGDLAPQRSVVSQALLNLNHDPAFAGRVDLIPYAYENVVPARTGMDPEEVVTSYMLRPEDADLLICLFWRRMGTPLERVINSATNAPYQSGTEYEFLSAYATYQRLGTPFLLLYRCSQPVPDLTTLEDQTQLARVNQFFARFQPGGDLLGLVGTFRDDEELSATIQRDVAKLLYDDLLPLLARRGDQHAAGPVIFGLPPLPSGYVERLESMDALRKGLLGSRPQVGVVAATALHGQGGLGKTVLARAICDDPAVRAAFPDGLLWATIGQHPDIARIQREWIRVLGGDLALASSPESGRAELTRLISDRALLMVLDDVWQAAAADALAVAGPHCRTLITTRAASQAGGATRVSLDLMTPDECRQTLRDAAGAKAPDGVTLDAIAERLGRLPLALKVVGGLLALDFTWPEIARELDEGRLTELAVGDRSIYAAMDVSVRLLPTDQRERYRELVIFPQDEPLNPAAVARLWGATGGTSSFTTRRLLAEFRDRSLLQADNTLHDLQVDYLRATVPPERILALHSALCDAYAASGASPWSTLPDDDTLYGWRFIPTHLSKAGREHDLEVLLTDVTWLQGKLARLGSVALVDDLNLLPAYEPFRLISLGVRAGSLVLNRAPDELLNQLRGRIGPIAELHHIPERQTPYFELYTQSLPQPDPALLRIFSGHTGDVNACAFSPNGALALSAAGDFASKDYTLRLWEVASGRELRRLEGHTSTVNACAFSPDGALALSASGDSFFISDDTLRLWEVASGRELRRFEGHTNQVNACAFSPSGAHLLSASDDQTLRLWEAASGRELRRFDGHTGKVKACAFSPNGALVLSASDDQSLRLWEVASGRELRRFEGHTGPVNTCAFSPDGTLALSVSGDFPSRDNTVRLWEVASGQEVRHFDGHTGLVNACAFSPDGILALSTEFTSLRLWEVASGRELRRFEGHTGSVTACAFSPDGAHILSASDDHTLRLWEVASERELRRFAGHTVPMNDCAFSPDGTLALSIELLSLRLWEVASGRELRRFEGRFFAVEESDCAFSPDGAIALSASGFMPGDDALHLWEVASGRELRRFEGHTGPVTACAFSPDGAFVLSAAGGFNSSDDTLHLWKVASGRELRHFEGHTDKVKACAFSPDGALILSASNDRTLRLWEVASGHELRRFEGHTGPVTACAFSPDGALVLSASDDDTLRLWAVSTGRELRRFEGHMSKVTSCAFSPDGIRVLSASNDQTLRLWEAASGVQLAMWQSDVAIRCCVFSPQGDRVMVGDRAGGPHFFKLIGVESLPSPIVPPITPATRAVLAAVTASVPAPEPASKPRRKRFWFF